MVEISFSDKSPDRLTTEKRSGKQLFGLLPEILPSCRFPAKPHLVGNIPTLYPTYCGKQEKFSKKLQQRYSPCECLKNPPSALQKPPLIRRCEQF